VHRRNSFRVLRKEKCQGEGTYRVTEHSVKKGSARCASSRRTPGGREAFLCKKYFELSYSKTQQHKEHANKNLSEVLKLRRNSARSALRVNLFQVRKLRRGSISITQTRPKRNSGSQEEESKAETFET
jgi:hypothetical protein